VEPVEIRTRVEEHIRRHELIAPGGAVTCLVSGGPDSACLWHVLRELGYAVSALHVNHRLRGSESDEDARFCAEVFGAEIVEIEGAGLTEAELRERRYAFATDRLRATGHTATDQVETVLYRLVSSGTATGIRVRRDDGVVRPLLCVWRDETEAYCDAERLSYRLDSTNADTKRGLIRGEILPLLRRLHPAAEANILAAHEPPPGLPRPLERALAELLQSREGSKRLDLGDGRVAVREYDRLWLERAPVRLTEAVRWGEWTIEPRVPGLVVRSWRAGDRLARRAKKVQDLFVDAKIPRSERETWPLVVRGDEVVLVPGVAVAPGFEEAAVATRDQDFFTRRGYAGEPEVPPHVNHGFPHATGGGAR
jgi:tRNA(Ile)-lysidine synthase